MPVRSLLAPDQRDVSHARSYSIVSDNTLSPSHNCPLSLIFPGVSWFFSRGFLDYSVFQGILWFRQFYQLAWYKVHFGSKSTY